MPKEIKRKKELIAGIESKLLGIVREADGISRLSLSKQLSLAPSTVGIYVERLLEEGFLVEAKKKKALKSGRPEVQLLVNPERGEFIGIDFFAERIMAMAVDFGNNKLREHVVAVCKTDSADILGKKLIQCIENVFPENREVLGIGISIPGSLEKKYGTLIKYKWLPNIENFEIGKIVRDKFNVPVSFENTANLMALGEMKFGCDRNLDDFVSVTIRSGIGCGVVIDSKIVAGENNLCGEIEYWKCPGVGEIGQLPELGELVSSSAIITQVEEQLTAGAESSLIKGCGIKDILKAFQEGDSLAVKVIGKSIPVLAWALGQMSLALAPKKLLLAGDFAELKDSWHLPLKEALDEYYNGLPMQPPIIALSTLGESCAALGAASMAVQNWRLSRL
ncbi:MAG: ROK family transcriptional regulator [Lentisphaerales bacterium]|nr:ROK family transcriptional regulator [Lentisphaerales bacterium]